MVSEIIDGKSIANDLCAKLTIKIKQLKEDYNVYPCLKVILVGDDSASHLYVRNKQKRAELIGIESETIFLPNSISEGELIDKIKELNCDEKVSGILVQLPVPGHIDSNLIINTIDSKKDVDGFHNENVGKLVTGQKDCLIPCTPRGCMHLIKSIEANLSGKNAIVIGRSNIVGKPMFHLLLRENCTVSILHSRSENLAMHCTRADIIVSAVGKPRLVKQDWIKRNAIVIDVGMNFIPEENRFVGDVDFLKVKEVSRAITPVPGGVGPMTIAFLMINTVFAACLQSSVDFDFLLI
ncbi:bifunctional methylenetetrahydrofolate dehydrogenase/methenyltetrahydrofolate cyclohydrolase FolD [Candidatus Mesenet endosymbiont of Agriotes lineatus]|uniref:bifunctional methylenetetrahydrofolate dehydrogenase/methenyltetrahydrofolate cyclohydrolase FolD n=1 Tax=Candidatus Mesenet endosymbiont of Agriotes lineatus TaxID=3077948 RepID=UPI0030CE959E